MSDLKQFNQLMRADYTQKYLQDVLGEKAPLFIANITALVANDAKLQVCEPQTIMYAAITATAMDLPFERSQGLAYVIPYKDNKTGKKVAQFQMGYKGYQQLAVRSGQYLDINATDVREGEIKSINRLNGKIRFEWNQTQERDKLPIIGYAAYFKLASGFSKTIYMTVEEIENHAIRYSETYRSDKDWVRKASKWVTDKDQMSKKTVLKKLLNDGTAPRSIEMRMAIAADQSVQYKENEYTYVDNSASDAKAELAERAKERAMVEDAESEDIVDESTGEVKPIDPTVNDLPFED